MNRILCAVILLALARGASAQPRATPSTKRWAVLVGVDDYKAQGLPKLEGATRDAHELRDALTTWGGFPADQVIVLTKEESAPERKPTRENVLTQLSETLDKVDEDGLFLFFFSGHGMFAAGTSFLVTENATAATYGALNREAIKADEIRSLIYGKKLKQVVYLLDACRSDQSAAIDDADRSFASAFPLPENLDFAVVHSTAQRKVSYETKRPPKSGYFTREVVKAIKRGTVSAGDQRARDLTIADLVDQLQTAVPDALAQDGRDRNAQVPQGKYSQRGARIVLGYHDGPTIAPEVGWVQIKPPDGALTMLSDDRLRVVIDGRELLRQDVQNSISLPPGPHSVAATFGRASLYEDRVDVRSGETTTVELELPPGQPQRRISRRVVWTGALAAAAVTAAIVSFVYRAKAGERESAVETACAMGCDWNAVERLDKEGRRFDLTQGLLLGASAAAAAGGVAMWFALKPRTGGDTLSGLGLSWRSTF